MAVTALAPAAADAALGGGNALTTSTRPDLRSATITSSPDSLANTSIVRVCFDKPVTTSNANAFRIGIYRTGDNNPQNGAEETLTATTVQNAGANCVDLKFPLSNLNPYTYLNTDLNAVTTTGGNTNLADSTALIGAASNNGTAGRTTGPDLTGVQAVNDTTVRYLFDQNVSNPGAGTNYHIVNKTNDTQSGGVAAAPTVDKNVVTVTGFTDALTAVKAYVEQDTAATDAGGDTNPLLSVNFPGFAQTTTGPDLQSASVSGDGSTVDFVFDQDIKAIAPTNPALGKGFYVTRSDGTRLPLTNAQIVNKRTVRTQLNQGTTQNEYLVVASVDANYVNGTNGQDNSSSGLKVGDNDGAFASGFTTGTDAVSVSFGANGVASLVLDQRFGTINSSQIRLIASDGSELTSNPVLISGSGGPAVRPTVRLQFVASELAKAVAVQLLPTAFLTFTDAPNVVQIIAAAPPVG